MGWGGEGIHDGGRHDSVNVRHFRYRNGACRGRSGGNGAPGRCSGDGGGLPFQRNGGGGYGFVLLRAGVKKREFKGRNGVCLGDRAHHLLEFYCSPDGAGILSRIQLVRRVELPVGCVCEGWASDAVDVARALHPDFDGDGFIGAEIPRIRAGGDAEVPHGVGEGGGSPLWEFLSRDFYFRDGHFHQYLRADEVGDEGICLRKGGAGRDSTGCHDFPGAQWKQGALEGHDVPVGAFIEHGTARLTAE